jgi:hypothetical protein
VVRIVFFIDRRHETPFNFESADLHEYRDRFKNDNTNLTVNKIIIEMIAFFNREEWNSEENEGFLCMHHVHRASIRHSSLVTLLLHGGGAAPLLICRRTIFQYS